MSSDVFIISSAHEPSASTAIRESVKLAGVPASRVQDAAFGLDAPSTPLDIDSIVRAAGLSCPAAGVSSSLRAIFFESAAILCDDVQVGIACGLQARAGSAFVLASPEAVGRLNLLPRARIAARSLGGQEPALRAAGITTDDLEVHKEGNQAAVLLHELLDELEAKPARWGIVTVGKAVTVVERV